jgi:UDP-N-acetylmuramate dehydrogenase
MLPGHVLFGEPLSCYTSIGVGGEADAIVFPKTIEELTGVLHCLRETGLPFIPLGNGTNLIVKDGGYRGVVVSLKGLHGLGMEETGDKVSIHAEAGVALAELIGLSLREGLTGVEFLAGIPGSVGGAVRMNAGAYGREIGDVLTSVTFMTKNGDIEEHDKGALNFSYRNLDVPPGFLILSAAFFLHRGEGREISDTIEKILAMRKEKHPLAYRNAGSIFKNPEGVSAGRIIEESGLKGLQVGGAKISEMHGNFIVNMGGAGAGDVIALIDRVKKKVLTEKGIMLETEVHIVGDDA